MEPTNQKEAGQEVTKLDQVIQIDEGKIQAHLGEVVRSTVEETLNAMLDAEADRLCRAERYERTEARQDTRAGSYQRQLHTQAGEVSLKIPKLRTLPFETAIIELICPPVPHGSYYDIRLAGGMARGEAVAAVAVGKFYRRGSQ